MRHSASCAKRPVLGQAVPARRQRGGALPVSEGMAGETVAKGKVVLIHYTLTDESGQVVDSTNGQDPMPYLHGARNIVPGLEKALEGRSVGDKLKVKIPPQAGYGPRRTPGPQAIPRNALPADAKLFPGMQLVAQNDKNESMPVWVIMAEDDKVIIDADHPLAGVVLNYEAEVVAVREPTAEEKKHGHPHGVDGEATH